MTPIDLAVSLIELVVRVAPGVLAAITGHASDEDALAHARAKVAALRHAPASSAIDDELHAAAGKPTGP